MQNVSLVFNPLEMVFDNTQVSVAPGQVQLLDLGGGVYSKLDPTVRLNTSFNISSIVSIVVSGIVGNVKMIPIVDGQMLYWNLVDLAWEPSNGTLLQSNYLSDIVANMSSLFLNYCTFSLIFILDSDGAVQTGFTGLSFSFLNVVPSLSLTKIKVFGYLTDIVGKTSKISQIRVKLNRKIANYSSTSSQSVVSDTEILVSVNPTSFYFEVYLLPNDVMPIGSNYEFFFDTFMCKRKIYSTPGEINFVSTEVAY